MKIPLDSFRANNVLFFKEGYVGHLKEIAKNYYEKLKSTTPDKIKNKDRVPMPHEFLHYDPDPIDGTLSNQNNASDEEPKKMICAYPLIVLAEWMDLFENMSTNLGLYAKLEITEGKEAYLGNVPEEFWWKYLAGYNLLLYTSSFTGPRPQTRIRGDYGLFNRASKIGYTIRNPKGDMIIGQTLDDSIRDAGYVFRNGITEFSKKCVGTVYDYDSQQEEEGNEEEGNEDRYEEAMKHDYFVPPTVGISYKKFDYNPKDTGEEDTGEEDTEDEDVEEEWWVTKYPENILTSIFNTAKTISPFMAGSSWLPGTEWETSTHKYEGYKPPFEGDDPAKEEPKYESDINVLEWLYHFSNDNSTDSINDVGGLGSNRALIAAKLVKQLLDGIASMGLKSSLVPKTVLDTFRSCDENWPLYRAKKYDPDKHDPDKHDDKNDPDIEKYTRTLWLPYARCFAEGLNWFHYDENSKELPLLEKKSDPLKSQGDPGPHIKLRPDLVESIINNVFKSSISTNGLVFSSVYSLDQIEADTVRNWARQDKDKRGPGEYYGILSSIWGCANPLFDNVGGRVGGIVVEKGQGDITYDIVSWEKVAGRPTTRKITDNDPSPGGLAEYVTITEYKYVPVYDNIRSKFFKENDEKGTLAFRTSIELQNSLEDHRAHTYSATFHDKESLENSENKYGPYDEYENLCNTKDDFDFSYTWAPRYKYAASGSATVVVSIGENTEKHIAFVKDPEGDGTIEVRGRYKYGIHPWLDPDGYKAGIMYVAEYNHKKSQDNLSDVLSAPNDDPVAYESKNISMEYGAQVSGCTAEVSLSLDHDFKSWDYKGTSLTVLKGTIDLSEFVSSDVIKDKMPEDLPFTSCSWSGSTRFIVGQLKTPGLKKSITNK